MRKPAGKQRRKGRLIGITGAIGSGKSTVSRVFRAAGYPVLNADELARTVVARGAPALTEIHTVFGEKAIRPDGELDRAFVRAQIARDPALRKQLDAITHPRIQELSRAAAAELFSRGHTLVFYEAPLLFESGSGARMDAVICVAADEERLLDRVMKRDGVGREEARALLAAQLPQDEKCRRSDYVLRNDGTEAELEAAALRLLEELRE